MGCDGFRIDMAGSLVKNDEGKEETIKLGKTMLESAIKEKGYSVSKLMQNLNEILKPYNYIEEEGDCFNRAKHKK